MKHRLSAGYIFFTTLLFLQVFSLMGIYAFMQAAMTIKKIDHEWSEYLYQFQARKILLMIEANLASNINNCLIPNMAAPDFKSQSIMWWQKNSCSEKIENLQYFYTIEDLGIDECGVIKNRNDQFEMTHYYRITLGILTEQAINLHPLLQSTIVIGSNEPVSCQTKPRLLQAGRQMLRIL